MYKLRSVIVINIHVYTNIHIDLDIQEYNWEEKAGVYNIKKELKYLN